MPDDTILLRNHYYRKGLTEGLVKNYYHIHRREIIREIKNRYVVLFLYTDINKFTVIRNINNEPFTLNPSNWDEVINPRVVSIAVEMPSYTEYCLIDVDVEESVPETKKKNAVRDIEEFFKFECRDIITSQKVAASSSGYHVYGILRDRMNLEYVRKDVKGRLQRYFGSRYRIDQKGKSSKPNFDLSSMNKRGSHTVVGALNLNGTRCVYVEDLQWFKRLSTAIR
jgi:hypothetical protein